MKTTQYRFYKITLETPQQHQEILDFQQRYPQLDIRNDFPTEDYLGFYPVYYTVTVVADTPLELVLLMAFPQAKLRTIMNTTASALG
jgi:hypothetical protein